MTHREVTASRVLEHFYLHPATVCYSLQEEAGGEGVCMCVCVCQHDISESFLQTKINFCSLYLSSRCVFVSHMGATSLKLHQHGSMWQPCEAPRLCLTGHTMKKDALAGTRRKGWNDPGSKVLLLIASLWVFMKLLVRYLQSDYSNGFYLCIVNKRNFIAVWYFLPIMSSTL